MIKEALYVSKHDQGALERVVIKRGTPRKEKHVLAAVKLGKR